MLNFLQNGGYSFISTPLLVHTTNATISTKNPFLYIFTFLFHPYLFTKSSLQSPLTLPSSKPQQFFTSLFLRTIILTIYTKNIFPTSTIELIQAASRDQGARESCEDWHCFNLSLLPLSMGSYNRAHNHRLPQQQP